MENEGNNENNGDKARLSIETDSAAKGEEDSFVTCEEGNENSGNASEEDVNDVEEEEEEEEAPPINQVFRSSKRKSRKTHVESDSDESKDDELASATMAEGKGKLGSQTRERKRSKYLSYPYYTDGFLKLIAKDSKIPKQLRESITEEDSKISKVSAGRKSNRKPCKNLVVSSNDLVVINMRCHEALLQLRMAAIDSCFPTRKNSFDSMKVFFSMFRNSAFRDESNTGLSSENTIQQRDVLESTVADRKTRSYDFSSSKVLALYSPRYLALYQPKTLQTSRKARNATRKDTIDKMDVVSLVTDKTRSPGLSSPIDKAELKRRNRKQKVAKDTPKPKRTNRTKRLKLMSLDNIATDSAVIAKLHNLESIPLMIDWSIDLEPRKDEKKSDASVSMNTDLCTDTQDADGNTWEDEKKKLASEDKPVRKRRGRKEKPGINHQVSCATEVQNLNENVVEPIIQGTGASKAKRGRKKKVTTQNSLINQHNGTSDGTNMIGNEAELVLLLGHEPRKDGKKSDALVIMNTDLCTCIKDTDGNIWEDEKMKLASEEKPVRKRRARNEKTGINHQASCATDVQNMNENVVEPIIPGTGASKAKRGRKKNVTRQNSVINQRNGTSDGTNMIGNEAVPVLLLGHEPRKDGKKSDALVIMNTDLCTYIQDADGNTWEDEKKKLASEEKPVRKRRARNEKKGINPEASCATDVQNLNEKKKLASEEKPVRKRSARNEKKGINPQASCATDVQNLNENVVEPIIQGTGASKAKRGRKKKATRQNSVINQHNGSSDGTNMTGNEAEPVLLLGHEAEPVLLLGHEAKLNEVESIILGTNASKAKRGRKKKVTTQNSVINQQNGTSDGTHLNGNEAESVLLLGHEVEPISLGNAMKPPVLLGNEAEPLSPRNEVGQVMPQNVSELVLMENEVEPVLMRNEAEWVSLGNAFPEAKPETTKKSYPVGGMPPLSVVKQNLETMTVMLAKTSLKVPAEMKSKLKDKIERLIVKVNAREGSSSSLT